jgi:hypothetical protein
MFENILTNTSFYLQILVLMLKFGNKGLGEGENPKCGVRGSTCGEPGHSGEALNPLCSYPSKSDLHRAVLLVEDSRWSGTDRLLGIPRDPALVVRRSSHSTPSVPDSIMLLHSSECSEMGSGSQILPLSPTLVYLGCL